jgi:hypothetical protein
MTSTGPTSAVSTGRRRPIFLGVSLMEVTSIAGGYQVR